MKDIDLNAVTSSFEVLGNLSRDLHQSRDRFSSTIAQFEDALSKLNIGLSVWIVLATLADGKTRGLGYAKIDNHWGLHLRIGSDNDFRVWPFTQAPTHLRIEAAGRIPDLLAELAVRIIDTIMVLDKKTASVEAMLEAIRAVPVVESQK